MLRVLVTNTKGGCGKTTLATSLAAAFAVGGLRTALAEVDRQKSSLAWLRLRPQSAASIEGLDWRKAPGEVGQGTQRLVIDAPANLRMAHIEGLIREADLVIVPMLASIFDEGSTARFLEKLEALKPIRKGRKQVALVANRLRRHSRAAQRLEAFLAECQPPVAARLSERAAYAELATQGLSVFDVGSRAGTSVRDEWLPLLRTVEAAG